MLKNKTILITGGTGSFGKKMTLELLTKYNIKKIIIFSRDEFKQFNLKKKFEKYSKKLRFFIGDVRDYERLNEAFAKVDIVIHAAALKHVPIAEYNPFEAVKTNVIGTQNVIRAALSNNVGKVLALSTDKASSPANLYGATKLTADKLIVAANYFKGWRSTKLSVVRYGNVLGSRGSILTALLKNENKIFPLTHPEMTRFNITLQEGVKFVLNSLESMWGGEIFVPKIPSYKLLDLIKVVKKDIKFKVVGIRAGEKMHEEMISINDSLNTIELKDSYVICPDKSMINWNYKKYIKSKKAKLCNKDFSYSSNKNRFLSHRDLKKIIDENYSDFEIFL